MLSWNQAAPVVAACAVMALLVVGACQPPSSREAGISGNLGGSVSTATTLPDPDSEPSSEPAEPFNGTNDCDEDALLRSSATDADGCDDPSTVANDDPIDIGPTVTEPLTGLVTPDTGRDLEHRRPLVVKVGNSMRAARPQAGLNEADIVFEELIEGARTRFVAVFHSEIPDRIGPVRSARSTDVDLMRDLGIPYFVYSGSNITVTSELRAARESGVFVDGGASSSSTFYQRDTTRRAPHNLFFYTDNESENFISRLESDSEPTVQPLFDFDTSTSEVASDGLVESKVVGAGVAGSEVVGSGVVGSDVAGSEVIESGLVESKVVGAGATAESTSGSDATAVGVLVSYRNPSAYPVAHIWDDEAQGWVRIQDGTLHVSETDGVSLAEIAPANVLIIKVDYKFSAADSESPQALSYSQGQAWVLTRGKVTEGRWERTEDRVGYRLFDSDGTNLTLSPGKTWVILANRTGSFPVTMIEPIYDDCSADAAACGSQMLADAQATAEVQ